MFRKRVRALRRSSGGHGRTGEKKIIFLLTATPGLCRDLAFVAAPGATFGEKNKKGRGDLSIMVRASPSGVPHLSSTPQPAGVQLDQAGTSAE